MSTALLILCLTLAAMLGTACGWCLRGAAEAHKAIRHLQFMERCIRAAHQAGPPAHPKIYRHRRIGTIRHYRN